MQVGRDVVKSKINVVAIVAILVVAGVATVILSLSGNESSSGETVTDELGRDVKLPEEINSIVCMGAGSLRLVSYLSSVDRVVGVEPQGAFYQSSDQTFYAVYKETLDQLPRVATDAESLIECDPDVVITSSIDLTAVNLLQDRTGITVYAVNNAYEINDKYFTQLLNLGKFLGKEDRARELVDGTKSLIEDITSKVTGTYDGKAYAGGMYFQGNPGFLKGTGNFQPFDLSKVPNAMPEADNKEPYIVLNETLIVYNPDIIFLDAVQLQDIVNEIVAGYDNYKEINAIKNDNIYSNMVTKCYMNNWENQLVNAFYVASVVNGGLYDWDFETKADEVMELYFKGMGVTYAQIEAIQGGCGKVTLPLT